MKYLGIILFITLLSCGTQQINNYTSSSTEVTKKYDNSDLDSLISPYKEGMDEAMNEVIGQSKYDLEKYTPESPLGNFAADVIYEAGLQYGKSTKDIGPGAMKNSFCLLNFGGLRAPINKGDITIGNIYEFMPFDNTLTLVLLKPEQIKELLIYVFTAHGQPISGASMQLSSDSQKLSIKGEPYNFKDDVVIVTSDYLANGGDKMSFFKAAFKSWDSGILLRDIFIDYVREQEELGEYSLEDKITFIKN